MREGLLGLLMLVAICAMCWFLVGMTSALLGYAIVLFFVRIDKRIPK